MSQQKQEMSGAERELNIFKWRNNMGLQAAFPTETAYLEFKDEAKAGRAAESDIFGEQVAFEWHGSRALRAEFVDADVYLAFKRAEGA